MSIFARIEYKTIKRRMKQDKEAGVKKGILTNGKQLFPYYYDKNTRSVLVDEMKHPIYRAIVEKYLNGTNLSKYYIKHGRTYLYSDAVIRTIADTRRVLYLHRISNRCTCHNSVVR